MCFYGTIAPEYPEGLNVHFYLLLQYRPQCHGVEVVTAAVPVCSHYIVVVSQLQFIITSSSTVHVYYSTTRV